MVSASPAFFWVAYSPLELLYDGDSYFHLAAARAYAQHGMLHSLPWARFSVMHAGFGDKELLFHLALAPFSGSTEGGKLALALLDATLLTSVVVLAGRALGWRGALWTMLLILASGTLALRAVRLRPELLAVTLLLWFTFQCARERYLAAAAIAALYALDPVFMFVPHPQQYAVQQALFDGSLLDVPLALQESLDSDFLAFARSTAPQLARRVQQDPRLTSVLPGHTRLYRVLPNHNADFVLDWAVALDDPPRNDPGTREHAFYLLRRLR